jgi:hypothetical protein
LVVVSSAEKQALAATTSAMPASACGRRSGGVRAARRSLDAVGQQFPHRRQRARQEGQLAQVGVALVGAVEVAAARGGQAELARRLGVLTYSAACGCR